PSPGPREPLWSRPTRRPSVSFLNQSKAVSGHFRPIKRPWATHSADSATSTVSKKAKKGAHFLLTQE
ncbi:hypothetical protein FRC08_016455, partial [Ceratobasidium sp. 394]